MAIIKVWNSNEFGTNIVGTLHDDGLFELSGTGTTLATFTYGTSPISYFRDRVTTVTKVETITNLGAYVFAGTYIDNESAQNILYNVSAGGNYTFRDCPNITSITWPTSRTWIPEGCFYACKNLTSITIPSTVVGINTYAFQYSGLTSITIPSSVITMNDYTFANCANLATVNWDADFHIIPDYTFQFCTSLTSFTIPSNVTGISTYAFQYSGLTSITIPSAIFSVGMYAFANCSDLATVNWDTDTDTIPAYTFQYCASLTSFTIPSTVTTINDYAFRDSGLTSITIPSTVTSMGTYVFDNCASLATVNWDTDFNTIPLRTFYNCTSLTSFTIPSTVTTMGNFAFRYSGLTSITIPSTVTSMGTYVFADCANLATVNWDTDFNTIPLCTFQDCTSLTSFTIPSTVTTINGSAFRDSGLTSITIPSTVTSMGTYVFYGCSDLATVNWDTALDTIPIYTFYDCTSLTSFTIPSTVTTINGSAFRGSGLTSITIPSTVTDMGTYVFENCANLATVNWDTDTDTIPAYTFQYCASLTSFTIPSTVTTINDYAFANCANLAHLVYRGTEGQTLSTNSLRGPTSLVDETVYVSIDATTFISRAKLYWFLNFDPDAYNPPPVLTVSQVEEAISLTWTYV